MLRQRLLLPFLVLLISAAAIAQKPTDVLVARIRKETGLKFTYKAVHEKIGGNWAVVMSLVTLKDNAAVKPKALGVLVKQGKKWVVVDYALNTSLAKPLQLMKKQFKKVPKGLWPTKV